MRGHLGTVFDHIDGGVKILSELQNKSRTTDNEVDEDIQTSSLYAPMATLNALFTRLDIQSSSMMSTRRLLLVPDENVTPSIESLTIPTTFYTFEEARDAQDTMFRCWHHDFRRTLTTGTEIPFREVPSPEEAKVLKKGYTTKLAEWNTVYTKFLLVNPEKKDQPADNVLQLCNIYISIHIDNNHAAAVYNDMIWDAFTPQFQKIVEHARIIIAATAEVSRKRVLFSIDNLLISPLYFVASRCRHPVIRREAIHCLKIANRQEGLWESRTLARVAQRVMELEEEGMGELVNGTEIPNWKRVNSVFPVLDPDGRRATIHFASRPMEEGGLPLINMKEDIEW